MANRGAGVAWVLNLDADLELAAGTKYAPPARAVDAMAPHVVRLASMLLAPGDVVIAPPSGAVAELHARGIAVAQAAPPAAAVSAPSRRARAHLEPRGSTVAEPPPAVSPSLAKVGGSGDSRSLANVVRAEDARSLAKVPLRSSLDASGSEQVLHEGWRGRAFCPTPRAIAALRAAGVEPEPHPSFEVLRRVNGRAFCAELGQTLPGAAFVERAADALAIMKEAPPIGRQWRAKRAFGMAGRGQRPIAAGAVSAADEQFLRASIERDGGIQIEPEVEIVRELSLHGLLDVTGGVRLGRVVLQRCDASGQWLESVALDDAGASLTAESLRGEGVRVAMALHAAGYFGPFGLDAFEYRARDGGVALNLRSEINARYSMGFSASGLMERR